MNWWTIGGIAYWVIGVFGSIALILDLEGELTVCGLLGIITIGWAVLPLIFILVKARECGGKVIFRRPY